MNANADEKMASPASVEVDVVVVGAGLSGLSAAYELTKRDPSLRVAVLEAKDRVGGRTLTTTLKAAGGEDVWDLGGQWVGSSQTHIMALIQELGLEVYSQYDKGKKYMKLGDNKIRTFTSIPALPFWVLIDLYFLMRKIDSMSSQVPIEDPYQCQYAEKWDSITVEEFMQQQCWTAGAKEAADCLFLILGGADCSQMSLLFLLAQTNAAGGTGAVFDSSQSGQEFKVKGGTQQISSLLAEKIGKQNIFLNHPVMTVTQDDTQVHITTTKGDVFKCSRAIFTTMPQQTASMQFNPCLPAEKLELFKRMPAGYIVKFIITYQTAFWRDEGFSGEIVSSGKTDLLLGVLDATSPNGNPALVGFVAAKHAVKWSSQEASKRKAAVLSAIAEFLGPQAEECLDYVEKNWGEEPYTLGGPGCIGGTGCMAYYAAGLRKPFKRIHFGGTESATAWCSYLSGAVQAGIRTAIEVLHHLRPQTVTQEELKQTAYCPDSAQKKND
ncbi:probable flavin-containing monoamine oxidase A [Lingula anatina]|uniref:Amine oxidase n=1 Tax=Lingula anatina TaxID=7574 RepID=A0A1S3I702_LINAN|nr:probable flavin-containing monoamine oxidase A [Lingula anatina]|eukprot:XP_013393626.1 probable flavin-containing monoamine oxidase A [Lingula anatina]